MLSLQVPVITLAMSLGPWGGNSVPPALHLMVSLHSSHTRSSSGKELGTFKQMAAAMSRSAWWCEAEQDTGRESWGSWGRSHRTAGSGDEILWSSPPGDPQTGISSLFTRVLVTSTGSTTWEPRVGQMETSLLFV